MAPPYPSTLPEGLVPYKLIGPFQQSEIPAGLLREHRLKDGVWGELTLHEGQVQFVWDDGSGDINDMSAPARLLVPPTVPHHLGRLAGAVISIQFFRCE